MGRLRLHGNHYRLEDGRIVRVLGVEAGSMDESWYVENVLTGEKLWVERLDLTLRGERLNEMEVLAWVTR